MNKHTWTGHERSALVVRILKSELTVAQAADQHDLEPREIEAWLALFLSASESALRSSRAHVPVRRKVVQALGAFVLAVGCLGAVSGVLADNAGCPNGLPYCFGAGTPARASEVNENFRSLLEQVNTVEAQTDALAAPGAVTKTALAAGAVTASALAAGAVTTSALADGAVTTSALANGAVTTTDLADASVTTSKLSAALQAEIAQLKSDMTKFKDRIDVTGADTILKAPSNRFLIGSNGATSVITLGSSEAITTDSYGTVYIWDNGRSPSRISALYNGAWH